MDAPVKTTFQLNLEAVLASLQPDPSKRTRLLSEKTEYSRQFADDLRKHGTENRTTIRRVAVALGVSEHSLTDPTLEGLIVRPAHVRLSQSVYRYTTWLDSERVIPKNPGTLVAREVSNRLWLGPFRAGVREPCHVVRWLEGGGEEVSAKPECTVAFCFTEPDPIFVAAMSAHVRGHGFTITTPTAQELLAEPWPDVLVSYGSGAEKISRTLNAAAGYVIPAIVLAEQPTEDDDLAGIYYALPNPVEILVNLREMTSFSVPVIPQ